MVRIRFTRVAPNRRLAAVNASVETTGLAGPRLLHLVHLEHGLRAQHHAAVASQVIALNVHGVQVALHVEQRQVGTPLGVGPLGADAVAITCVRQHLAVGPGVQVLAERLGLQRGEVLERVAELLVELTFAGAGHGGHQPLLGKVLAALNHHLAHAQFAELKPACVAALEDPALELVLRVLEPPPTLDLEELRVHRLAIDEHGVGLEAGCLGGAHSVSCGLPNDGVLPAEKPAGPSGQGASAR
jgi:hypothetical protein